MITYGLTRSEYPHRVGLCRQHRHLPGALLQTLVAHKQLRLPTREVADGPHVAPAFGVLHQRPVSAHQPGRRVNPGIASALSAGLVMTSWGPVASAEEDRRLHERMVVGDLRALAELYDQFGSVVFGVALRVTTDRHAAEDITQAVFLDLWRCPERFDPKRGPLRPWLATVAHHRGVDWMRREQAVRRRDLDEGRARLVEPVPDIGETVEAVLMAERVRLAVADSQRRNECRSASPTSATGPTARWRRISTSQK